RRQFGGGGASGAVGANGRCRRAVADEVHARIPGDLRGQPAAHPDAPVWLTQHQWQQVIQRTAKSRTPQDDIHVQRAAVGPPYAPLRNFAEHWLPVQHAARPHGFDGGGDGQSGNRHHGCGGQPLAHAVFDQGHGGAPVFFGEGPFAERRRPAGDPRGGGHLRDFVEQLYGRDAGTDDDDMPPAERFGRVVVSGVRLLAPEPLRAGVFGYVGRFPRARGVDDAPRREQAPVGFHAEALPAVADNDDLRRPVYRQLKFLFVGFEV